MIEAEVEYRKLRSFIKQTSNHVRPNVKALEKSIAQLESELKKKKEEVGRMRKEREDQQRTVDELLLMVKDLKNNKEEREIIRQRNILIEKTKQFSQEILRYKRTEVESKQRISRLLEEIQQLKQRQASESQRFREQMADKIEKMEGIRTLAKQKERQALKSEEGLRKMVESLQAAAQVRNEKVKSLEERIETLQQRAADQKECKALRSSDILTEFDKARKFIVTAVSTSEKRQIRRTRLLFKYDQFHKGFGNYVTNCQSPLLLLVRLSNGRICGGFCPKMQSDSEKDNSLLFTFLNEGKVFTRIQGFKKGCCYSNNSLTFGNNELVIMNNQAKQLRIGVNHFTARYFNMRQQQFVEDNNSNVIPFEEMQLHTVDFY